MPIDVDIREHEFLGAIIKDAERKVLRRQMEKRFGALPRWAAEKLTSLSASELEDLIVRVLDARSVEELLR
jgi:hypothetical protein